MELEISKINEIALRAGSAILKIYETENFDVEIKSDNSPLTKADKVSHEIIKSELERVYPEIPILSEEGKDIPFEVRKNWKRFWLVDPLDGTKEFINRNDEFTVNIALIEKNEPTLGVIYAPVLDTIYYAQKSSGAFKQVGNRDPIQIHVNKNVGNGIIAVKSRSHSSPVEEKVLSEYNVVDSISVGSSLKFCMVAEGKAHIYYRRGPTNEWDVGAGFCIAESAGATIEGLRFNKENLLNSSFRIVA